MRNKKVLKMEMKSFLPYKTVEKIQRSDMYKALNRMPSTWHWLAMFDGSHNFT